MAESQPGYAADENSKPGYVRLKVRIDGLKTKRSCCEKLFGINSQSHPEGQNATIEDPQFHSRGFNLRVRGKQSGSMSGKRYTLCVNQLPHDIEEANSYMTAEDGWINIFLKKADHHASWESNIRAGKLETA